MRESMPIVGLGIDRYSTLSEAAFSSLQLAKNWYVQHIQACNMKKSASFSDTQRYSVSEPFC
jgi:hypothetical protein